MSTWREKFLGNDNDPNRRRSLTIRLTDGVIGGVLKAKASVLNTIGLGDERQSPSGRSDRISHGSSEDVVSPASPVSNPGNSPGTRRRSKLPKRVSILENDPWKKSLGRSEQPKTFLSSTIGRRRRQKAQAELCKDPEDVDLEMSTAAESSGHEEMELPQSSPVTIIPPRIPSPGLLSLIALERKEWLVDGNNKPEQILNPERRRRLRSDVEVLTEPLESRSLASVSAETQYPEDHHPMPGTNLPLFSPNEGPLAELEPPPYDYFGEQCPDSACGLERMRKGSNGSTYSDQVTINRSSERFKDDSGSSDNCSTSYLATNTMTEAIVHKEDNLDDDPFYNLPEPKDEARNEVLPLPVKQVSIFIAESEDYENSGSKTSTRKATLGNERVALQSISENIVTLSRKLDISDIDDILRVDSWPAKPSIYPQYDIEAEEVQVTDSMQTGSPKLDSKKSTPKASYSPSPNMGSKGKFDAARAERDRRYQQLMSEDTDSDTEWSPLSSRPPSYTMHACNSPSPSPRAWATNAGFGTGDRQGSPTQRSYRSIVPQRYMNRGKRSRRNVKGFSEPFEIAIDPPVSSYDISQREHQTFNANECTASLTPPLHPSKSEDSDRPFVAARLPLFAPATPAEARMPQKFVQVSEVSREPASSATPEICSPFWLGSVGFTALELPHGTSPSSVSLPISSWEKLTNVDTPQLATRLDRFSTPNQKLDRSALPPVGDWLKNHNFHKSVEALEDVDWPELLQMDNKGLMRREVGSYSVRKKMLKELGMVKADPAYAYRVMCSD